MWTQKINGSICPEPRQWPGLQQSKHLRGKQRRISEQPPHGQQQAQSNLLGEMGQNGAGKTRLTVTEEAAVCEVVLDTEMLPGRGCMYPG